MLRTLPGVEHLPIRLPNRLRKNSRVPQASGFTPGVLRVAAQVVSSVTQTPDLFLRTLASPSPPCRACPLTTPRAEGSFVGGQSFRVGSPRGQEFSGSRRSSVSRLQL